MTTVAPGTVRTAVFVTSTEPEPRTFGKQVVIGGLLDHLCAALGADCVHVVLIGRAGVDRPATRYRRHLIAKPTAGDQAAAIVRRVLAPPHTALQEAALWSPRVGRELALVLADLDADLEVWDTMRVGQYAAGLPARSARRVLYADDLYSKRYAATLHQLRHDRSGVENPLGEFGKLLPGPVGRLAAHPAVFGPLLRLERRLTARSEDAAPAGFDATVLVNPDETAELRHRSGSDSVHTLVPLLSEPTPSVRSHTGGSPFVFLGGLDFPPNRDGLSWFLRTCRAPVLAAVPDFRLLVVGRGAERLPAAAAAWGDRVRPLGWVDDLDAVLGSATALLSPLRIGSGIKIKVLEALARGLPVVATPHGVLGVHVSVAEGCLVGDSPTELAELMRRAADPRTNAVLSAAAAASWRSTFAPAVVGRDYDRVLGLAGGRAREAP